MPARTTSEPSNPRARGSQAKLTLKQRRLIAEFEEIAASIQMDYWNILDYREDGRTVILELMKQQLIRGEIIMRYTFIDECLSLIVCHYYFKAPKQQFSFPRLWRTKKFQIFAHYFLDETYLLKKMDFVSAIKQIPSPIKSAIARINDVRNAVAHSFFPENRRQYKGRGYRKVMYRDTDIFSKEGVAKFLEDTQRVQDYLLQQAYGVDPAAARAEIEGE
jgi:hypothetical protein